jgi:hypothetical protein
MRITLVRHALLPLLAAFVLAGCHGKDDPTQPGGSTPVAAVQSSVELLKKGDIAGLWKHALPPADYATLRADWSKRDPNQPPITEQDRARFNETLQKFTAPDAEQKLYAELEPKLTQMEQQYKDQLPVLISMGDALVKRGIAQNTTLDAQQKTQANAVVDVLAPWAQKTPWFDQAKAKQAVHVAVTTVRQLDLKSPEALRAMDFDTAMKKYAIGYAGAKQLLAIYGLSVDDTLDSIKLSELENKDGHARVKIDYTLLGKPLSTETAMVEVDGRWYSESMLKNARQSHQQHEDNAAAAAPAPAPAGSAAHTD